MSVADWLEIYRAYSALELEEELASLRKSLKGGFVSQGSGNVQHSKDLAELRDRLKAATRVRGERGGAERPSTVAVVDFSGNRPEHF